MTCPHGSLRRSCEPCELVDALQEACGLALDHGRLMEEAAGLWPYGHGCYSHEVIDDVCRNCGPNPYRSTP